MALIETQTGDVDDVVKAGHGEELQSERKGLPIPDIRCMEKLVDEPAMGRPMEKILRAEDAGPSAIQSSVGGMHR